MSHSMIFPCWCPPCHPVHTQPQVLVLSSGDGDNLGQVGMAFSLKVWGIHLEIMLLSTDLTGNISQSFENALL